MKTATFLRFAACAAVVALAGEAGAWFGPGHEIATRLAVRALPPDAPLFFRRGWRTVAHCSQDPDLFRLRALPQARSGEGPNHYLDLELLGGAKLPLTRERFSALCARKKLTVWKVGAVPYAVAEWTQRLTLAFAEYRRWPKNPAIRAKALVYAGLLAHYAQDLCQPLHTTVHFDGRTRPDGKSPRSGIHPKTDALIQKAPAGGVEKLAGLRPRVFVSVFDEAVAELMRSHALVDRVYAIEKGLPAMDKPLAPKTPAAQLADERLRAAAEFTASLYLTAWRHSAKLKLPVWHTRKGD